ncbi:MAG: DUF3786 domain-containing protein [Bacillota bacterium]
MSKNYNLEVTYEYACNKLRTKEPAEMARNSGAAWDADRGVIILPYLGEEYTVSYPEGKVSYAAKDDEVPLKDQALLLHYLCTANGAPVQGNFISFKELPDGAIYTDPFRRRAIEPMLKVFGENHELFLQVAEKLGGVKQELGDVSVTVPVFPRVPVTYVMWAGDDEFPATGNILFDASAPNYLPTEDYAVAASNVVYKMAGMAR